ncbi:hypothetical protein ACA910_017766 [Epithemia clementina (nom. ined.)]
MEKIQLLSSLDSGAVARASSVLNRNTKTFGPMNILDLENSSTCWNSEGTMSGGETRNQSQWIQVEFPGRIVRPTSIYVQFQPGFSCEGCLIQFLRPDEDSSNNANEQEKVQLILAGQEALEFEDVHTLQQQDLSTSHPCSAIRLVWEDGQFADLYGRVIIYQLQVWGHELATPEPKKTG